ncbi:MAG: hypothetical protein NC395_01555 [Prevotella sp.]|nr:hypothetical protein [Prevotella sp.]
MKKRLWGAVLAAVLFSGCSGNGGQSVDMQTFAFSETVPQASENVSSAPSETAAEKETVTEAAAEEEYAEVSPDNEFIDYEFIEDYQGRTDIGVLAAKAVDFLAESEYYAESAENIGEFTGEEFKIYFDEGGNILPRLRTAYPEDYDGDGNTETFIIVDMPIVQGEQPLVRSFFIFADSRGEMTVLSDASHLYDVILLDYGDFKQITFGGSGTCGADDRTGLYGVIDGRAKELYYGRFQLFKEDCFLSVFGRMDSGGFMYYDTAAREYRAIPGKQLSADEIRAMDKDGVLDGFFESDEYGERRYGVVGGKYYCVNLGAGVTEAVFTYDGKFKRVENSNVRMNLENFSGCKAVADIDIEQAIAEMKSVK